MPSNGWTVLHHRCIVERAGTAKNLSISTRDAEDVFGRAAVGCVEPLV